MFSGNSNSLFYKIWIPYTIIILVIAITIAMYYPEKQRELFFEHEEAELEALALNIANAVEVSFIHNDYTNLQKTVNYISSKKSFEFIAIITIDSLGNEEVFNVIPAEKTSLASAYDPKKYLVNESSFTTEVVNGKILIASSMLEINKEIAKLHYPIYSFLFTMLVVSLTIFYFITKRISSPIRQVTEIAKVLESGNYNVAIKKSESQDEIGLLQNAFYSLKASLLVQKNKNDELNRGLELKVEERTKELQQALNGLNQAQQTTRIGSYCFYLQNKTSNSSFTFNQILQFDFTENNLYTDWLNYIADEDRNEVLFEIKYCIKNKKVFNKDFRIITGYSKELKWIHCLANIDFENGKPLKISGTIQDITERRKIENELYKLSLVAKNTTNGVIITDKDKNIVWINDSITKISGYTFEELKGRTPKIFQFEETNHDTVKFINEKISRFEPVKAEIKNKGKTGNVYWIELYIQPLYDAKHEVMGFMAIEIDITERKKAEAELESLNRTLEERVVSRTKDLEESYNNLQNVSYIISHDLKAPIRHTLFYSHLLKEHLKDNIDKKGEELINNINNAGEKMKRLIEGLLEFNRIGNKLLELKEIDTYKMVTQIAEMYKNINGNLNIEFTISSMPFINADETLIEQVFSNLISNAVKYSSKKSNIEIQVLYNEDNNFHVFTVKDNGAGFDMAHAQNLFKMFNRLHGPNEFDGNGIGLANSKRIIDKHRGKITFYSQPEEGATFSFSIPKNINYLV